MRLDYEVTKVSGRFSKVHLQYSEEFEKVMAANKKVLKIDALSEDDAVTEVNTSENVTLIFELGGMEEERPLCLDEC